MDLSVVSTYDVSKIAKARGLGGDHGLQKYLAARICLRCDPYVPHRSGPLKNTARINSDGSKLIYVQPYANYQYRGKVMGPNVLTKHGWRSMAKKGGKFYTGRALSYHGAPMRGPEWDKRMMAAHRKDVEADVMAYIRRGK